MIWSLIALQAFHVLFLAGHDWVPLGRWNDVTAVRAANPGGRLLRTTLVSAAPYAIGLAGSIWAVVRHTPGWLPAWLWISYGVLFAGELRAWWVPYLLSPDPVRAARYQAMFGRTYSFLPLRNGIRVNALHALLHAATLATLLLLAFTRL